MTVYAPSSYNKTNSGTNNKLAMIPYFKGNLNGSENAFSDQMADNLASFKRMRNKINTYIQLAKPCISYKFYFKLVSVCVT